MKNLIKVIGLTIFCCMTTAFYAQSSKTTFLKGPMAKNIKPWQKKPNRGVKLYKQAKATKQLSSYESFGVVLRKKEDNQLPDLTRTREKKKRTNKKGS